METKTCARCKEQYEEETSSPFITCQNCRRPFPPMVGGCTRWERVVQDPRITTDRMLKLQVGETF